MRCDMIEFPGEGELMKLLAAELGSIVFGIPCLLNCSFRACMSEVGVVSCSSLTSMKSEK